METVNGIQWREWSDETFDAAQKLDKPILLAIGATWCHWCHVMDHTSYADPAIIDIINREFIPVRVDTDRRPDVNDRYNLGGWPTTAFLTPRGDMLTGGTYIPPDQMRQIAARVAQAYQQRKAEIYSEILKQKQERQAPPSDLTALPPLNDAAPAIREALTQGIIQTADPANGGFGDSPKFPTFPALRTALAYYFFSRDERLKEILVRTLDGMGNGGMYDPVEGGFFRYSTTADWKVPHFEKMSEDLAQFIPLYLSASVALERADFKEKALDVVRYVLNSLYDPDAGAFYGSQDADEEYYALPLEERQERAAPFIDRTFYVNWNGRMASAFLRAYQTLGDEAHLEIALKTLSFLRMKCATPDGLCHYYDPGASSGHHSGWLEDQVYPALAALDAYESTGDAGWLEWAECLATCILKLEDNKEGGFFDVPVSSNAPGLLKDTRKPLPDNADAALVFLRLYELAGKEEYKATAERTLRALLTTFVNWGIFAGDYALAVERFVRGPLDAHLVGDANAMDALKAAVLKEYHPFRAVRHLDPTRDLDALKALGYPPEKAALYLCANGACLAPITDPAAIPAAASIFSKSSQL